MKPDSAQRASQASEERKEGKQEEVQEVTLRLAGKVAVITGGASALVVRAPTRLAAEGASVVLGDINLELAVAAAADIEGAGGTALAVELDAASVTDNASMFQTAVDKYGRLDVVVAAAGLAHAGYISGESNEKATSSSSISRSTTGSG